MGSPRLIVHASSRFKDGAKGRNNARVGVHARLLHTLSQQRTTPKRLERWQPFDSDRFTYWRPPEQVCRYCIIFFLPTKESGCRTEQIIQRSRNRVGCGRPGRGRGRGSFSNHCGEPVPDCTKPIMGQYMLGTVVRYNRRFPTFGMALAL
jgi:hypothetical protein